MSATQIIAPWTTQIPYTSQWSTTFELQDDDGNQMDIIGKIFELVIRTTTRDSGTPAARINSVAPTAQGYILVDTLNSTIQTVLSPTGSGALSVGNTMPLTLWMNQGLADATALVVGLAYISPVTVA